LILSLLVLLVLYLGFLYTMRGVIQETQINGNFVARHKAQQVADVALRQLQGLAYSTSQGVALELSASAQPWYRDVKPGTASPTSTSPTYWSSCLGNSDTTLRCGSIPVKIGSSALPYGVLAVAQPTGRVEQYSSCPNGLTAMYYDVYLYVSESTTADDTNTSGGNFESVMLICVPGSSTS
jgi:Tfp pilus assembly protein PilX